MGEPTPKAGGRQFIIIATVITVVFFTFFLVGIRSCSTSSSNNEQKVSSSHTIIYSNLDLKDAALVITRLKDLKIPYQIKDNGHAIAVPKAKADEARLGLAAKNLPGGGTVGWEIFDQSKLGATDFDRRIQFVRAISGELARTINRINAIEDARVQIVIPETKLFEVSKAPVTASVLLKMKPGETLTSRQVSGIVSLVAGSVENLKPGNVTIIDTNGNILTGAGVKAVAAVQEEQIMTPREEEAEEIVIEKESEKKSLEVSAKLELEDKLNSKVQTLLNRIFPPNVSISRVNVDNIRNKKTTVVILIDSKFPLNQSIKQETYDTVAAAIGYDKLKGDKIVMKSVTFRSTGVVSSSTGKQGAQTDVTLAKAKQYAKAIYRKLGKKTSMAIAGVSIFLFLIMLMLLSGGRKKYPKEYEQEPEPVNAEEEQPGEDLPVLENMRTLAIGNPQQAAQLIMRWISEGQT